MRTFAQFTKNHTNQSVAGDCSSLHPVMDKGIISQSKSEQNIGSNTYPVQKFQLSIRAFVLMIIMFSSIGFYTSLFGQAVGDYGTRYNTGTSTAWATGTNWVICVSAGTWTGATTAAAAPTNTKNVWIRAGANYNVAANSTCLNLDIASTGSLSVGGFTFTVSGTTSISGTFTITSNTAVKTFTGLVTMNSGGSWTSTTSTTATRLIFKNGITNNSSNIFNAGGATFNTNAQVTGGTGSFSFSQVTVTGVTVTNNTVFTVTTALGGTGQLTNAATGTLNLSGTGASCSITTLANAGIINRSNTGTTTTALANFTNTGTINITGSGTITGIINNAAGIVNHSGSSAITSFTNATATSTLNISTTPTVPTITTLTAATAGNTVNYSGAGNQTVKATAYSNLTISGNGTKTLAAATPTVNGVLTVKAGATLDLGGNALGATTAPTSVVLEIGSTGSIISGTTGALNLGGNVTVNATTGSSGATISCPISLDGTRTFTVADDGTAATDLTISGVMSLGTGTGWGITKAGLGTLVLSGTNTYTGTTTVGAGIVDIQNSSALGTTAGVTTVSANASVQVDGTGLSIAEPITLNNSSGISSGGALRNLANSNTWSGAITLTTAGRVNSDAGTLTLTGGVTGAVGTAFTVGGAGNVTMNTTGINTGTSGTLTKDGTGTLTLNASGTYTGGTTVSAGIVDIQNNTALGSTGGITTVSANASVQVDGTGLSIAEPITLNNSDGISLGGALRNLANNNTWTGAITLTTAGRVNSDAGTLTLTGGVTGAVGTAFTVGGAGNVTMNTTGINTGASGTLTKDGTGTLTLNASGTYTGGTTVSAGIVDVQNNTALGSTGGVTTVSANAAVQVDGTGLSIAEPITLNNSSGISSGGALRNLANSNTWSGAITLTTAGRVNSDAGTLTLTGGVTGAAGTAFTVGGAGNVTMNTTGINTGISGTLTKDGTGTLTLNASGTYTGGTTLSVGQLNINHLTAIGSGSLTISSGTTIDNTSGLAIGPLTNNNAQTWNGNFTFNGSNDLDMGTGAITMGADVVITSSTIGKTLTAGGTNNNSTRSLSKAGNGNLTFGSTAITLNNFTVIAGTLTSTSGILSVAGNFSNSSIFAHNIGTVNVNGSTVQTIGGSTSSTFNNLTIANTSGGVSLTKNETVSGVLTLTNGILSTDATNYMAVTNNSGGAVTGSSASSYVNGPLQWTLLSGNSYLFPVGDAANYRPFELNSTVCSSPVIRVTMASTGASTVDGTLSSVAARNWYAQLMSGTFTSATVRLTETGLTTSNSVASATVAQSGPYTNQGGNSIAGGTITSNAAIPYSGSTYFAIGTLPPTVVLSNNGTQVAAANVVGGTNNVVLHQSALAVTVANATLTGMTCTTAGSYVSADITNMKVWYQTTSTFNAGTATLLSTFTNPGIAGAKTFPSFVSQSITSGTSGYIFITADVAPGAVLGHTINLSALTTGDFSFTLATKSGSTTAGGAQTIIAGTATKLVYTVVPSTGTAGTAFSVTVQSQDANGNPSNPTSNTTITLSKATGAGTLSGTLTGIITTAGNSVTIATPVYSKADVMTLTATATVGMTGLTAVTSGNITFSAGTATHLVYTTVPSTGTAGTAFSVTVQSQDANGNPSNPTSNTTITLSKATGAGTLSGTLTGIITTAGNSVTIATPVYSKADVMTLTATATVGMTGLTAITSGNITFSAGTATHLVYTTVPSTGTAGTAFSVTVQSQDANGNPSNPTSNTTITLSKATGAGTLSGTLTGIITTAGNSVTIATPVYSKADVMTLTATATVGMTGLTAVTSGNITFSAGTATHLVYTTVPSTGTAGTAFSVTVQSQDANGNPSNPTSNTTITLSKATGAGTLSGTLTGIITTAGNSVTIATPVYSMADVMTLTATATVGMTGLTAVTSGNITFSAGTVDHFVISAISSPQTAGTAITGITLTAQDFNNNTATSFVSTVTYSGTAGITGTSATFTAGVLSGVSATPTVSGTSLTFVVTGSTKTGTATIATINSGALDHFAISTITSPQTAGTAITGITLTAQDIYNNTATSFISTVTYSGTAGITGTSAAFTAGVLSGVSLTPTVAGTGMTLIITGSTKTGTSAFNVNPGAATQIAINAGNGQSATVGTAVAILPSVIVKDANNNVVSGVAVTFAVAFGGGSATGLAATTNASGIATVGSWTLGTTAGANSLTATSAGLTGSPRTFTATGTAGAATQIAINAGDGQTATAGSTVAILPSVIVKDVNNNVVSGVAVTFADTGGGSGTGLNATTNASGIATVGSWTLSATAGANSLTATSAGLTGSPLTFTATGIAGTATQIAINAGDGQTATVATAVAILPSVIVSDANNNPVSGVTVIFSVASGGGFGTGLSKTTDVNGIASISSWTLGNTVGTNTLTATSTGLTGSPSTFTATGTAGVETQIAINAGNGQSATAGTAVAILPSAIVKDVYNNPVSGVAVTFAVASGGGSGTGFNATTDVNGIATVGSWTLGATAGTNTLTATSGTLTGSPVTFTATGTAVPAAISTVTGGPWATAGTWVGNAVPLTTQDAIINGPVSVGATINQTGSVTINNGGTLTATTGGTTVTIGALTINTGGTLTNSRTLTINGATNITGTINLQTSVRTNAFNGDITLNSGAIWNEIVGNTPTITGNFTNNATTFTASTGLYTFSGASNTFSGATTTAIPSVNISGNYTNNGTLTVNTALSGAGTLTNAATLNLAGTCSTATISNTGTINSSGTGTTTTATLTNSGAFNMSGTGAVTAFTNNTTGVLNISSTTVPAFTTLTATAAGNTVNYSGAAQTIKATTYSNLTLSGTGGKTFPTGTTTVNNILSIENAANANTFTGTLSYGANATLQYNTSSARVAGAEWISPFVATGGVVIANTGAITINSPEVFNATAPLTINSGATLNMSTNLLTLNGDLINNGGTTSGSGGVTITGTATQNIGAFTTTGTVLMSKTSGTATFTGNVSGAGLTINGTAGILNLGTGLTHTFSGTWTRTAGTLNGGSSSVSFSNATAFSGTGGTFTANAGTVNYSRAGTQNIAVLTYNNLILSGGGGFAKTFTATTTINGNLSIAASTIANLGAGLTHPANSLTLGGAGQVSGTWGGTGSAATNINTTYFTATTGIVNVSSMGAPTAISATPNSINFGDTGTISLTASGGGGTGATLTWYAGGCGSGASIGTGSPLVINKPAVTTTYYARWESGLQYSSCLSATVTVSNATFYSYQSGDWNTANTWTTDPSGSFWVNGGIPASTDHVIILNGRTITVNENGKTINSLELRLGGTLDLQATNTHNFGTVTGQGVLKLASGIFPGGTYTGFVAVTGGTVEYYNLNNQSISSTQLTYNKLIVSNYTASAYTTYLDNASNNISYTLNGTFDLMNHGAGSLTFYFGNPTPSDNLINMTVAGNFSVASGCTIGVNNFASAHTIAASDVSTSLVNPVHSLTLNGNFTNNGSVRFTGLPSPFNNAYYLLTTTANGGINYGDVQVIFTGAANNTVTCNGTTDFFRFIVEKGSDQTYTLDVNSSNTANFALYGPNNMGNNNFAGFGYYYKALFLHYGTLKLNSNISIPSISEGGQDFLLNPSASLWVNGANVSTTVSGLNGTAYQAATFYGKLRVSSGQFSTGDAAGIVLGNLSTPEINIEGTGTLDVSQVWNATGASNLISYTQTGGTANFRLMGENHAGAVLSLDNPNTVFNMSGGTINFTNNAFIDASTDYRLFNIQVQPGKYTITGGTLNVNVPGSATVYTSNTTVPFYNMNLTNRTGLGTVTLQMEAPGPNLTVLNDFSIGNGAILDMNINTIGLEVDRNFSIASGGTYTPGANTTTFNGSGVQTFTNTGTISTGLYNFTLSNTSNTNITNNLIVTGLLTIGNGCILNDQGFTINANGNIINSGTHSSQANGSILLNGTLAQTIGGSGTGIFGNLGLDKAAGTTSFVANQAINGNLRLVTGILNIANHNLKFSATSAIYDALTGTAAPTTFGDTKMIKTTGSQSDGGVTKTFSATGSFLYPFGAATYHPATIAISQAPTHWGDVTVKPVAVVHPSVDPIKNALTYYWKVTSSSITGIQPGSISHTYHYNPADVTGNDNTYITGVYRPFAWVKGDALQVDIIGKNIYFPAIQYLDGEYTAGETTAFGTVKVYYSRANGNWDTTTTWSLVSNADGTSPGTIPGPSDLVVIGDGGTNNHLVTISANTKIVSGLQINTGSTLDVNTTTGHIFGSVTGIGKLRISSSAATAVFPSGDFGSFLGVAGGTVEYYNETAPGNIGIAFTLPTTYLLGSTPANIATYYNLILSPATGKNITMPDTDLLIYKDMNINVSGSSVTGIALLNIQNTTRNITINGNLNVNNGNLQFTNAGSIAQNVSVVGDVTVASGATFDVAANLAATNTLSVQGNLTNNGIFDMIAGVGQICDVTFTGAANKQINGTTATRTDFNTLTINKGTDRTSILEATVNAMTLNSTLASAMTLTNGTFRLSNAGVNLILSTTNSFTIPSTGCLSANLGTLNVGAANNNASDLLLLGRLEILNAGIVNIGNNGGSNNDIEYAASGSPEINISGGSLNVDGQVRRNLANNLGSLIYNQSGGTVTVKGNSFDATRSMFEVLNTGSQFNVTGGNIVIVKAGSSYADLDLEPGSYIVNGSNGGQQ